MSSPTAAPEPILDAWLFSVDDAPVDEGVNADEFAIALSVRMQVPMVTGEPEISRISPADLKLHWTGK